MSRSIKPKTILELEYQQSIGRRYAKEIIKIVKKHYRHLSEEAITAFELTGDFAELTADEILNRNKFLMQELNEEIDYTAESFVYGISGKIDSNFRNGYKKIRKPIPEILINTYKRTNDAQKNMINLQVKRIVELLDYQYDKIDNVIQTAIIQKKALPEVKKELRETGIFGTRPLPKIYGGDIEKRIRWVAHNQLTYATSMLWKDRSEELGHYLHIWRHPPDSRYKTKPRPDHKKADGTQFDIRKGCLISGEYIQPSEKINCECYSELVIE